MTTASSFGDFAPDAAQVHPAAGSDEAEATARPGRYGLVHVVPLRPGASGSHWALEAAYRVLEWLVALVMFLVALPFMLIEAALIRLDSKGGPLFCQPRVAQSELVRGADLGRRAGLLPPPEGYDPDALYYVPQTFRFYKFRTMVHDAKERFPELYAYRFTPGTFHHATFKTDNDPRVTRLGTLLRRLTLDELPNLWCVLAGTMRLVGPRPELPELPQNYTAAEMYKFSVKPGITGLAQINGRGLLSWGETLQWDLRYVETRTVWLDLKILAVTVWFVIVRRGAF